MGKLIKSLEAQLKITERKKDAEDCIKLYHWVKETDKDGKVWSSRWQPLTEVTFVGFPSSKRFYKPSITGYAILKGINKK